MGSSPRSLFVFLKKVHGYILKKVLQSLPPFTSQKLPNRSSDFCKISRPITNIQDSHIKVLRTKYVNCRFQLSFRSVLKTFINQYLELSIATAELKYRMHKNVFNRSPLQQITMESKHILISFLPHDSLSFIINLNFDLNLNTACFNDYLSTPG